MPEVLDLQGQRYGRLTAINYRRVRLGGAGRKVIKWRCKCDCGNETEVFANQLRGGRTRSCGCLHMENSKTVNRTHGMTRKLPEWNIWWSMISRCIYPKLQNYKYYGGRGIKVCDRWWYGEGGKSGFECFLADMGRRPSPELRIDRINNDGNYEPSNCRWATHSENIFNSRHSLEYKAKTRREAG